MSNTYTGGNIMPDEFSAAEILRNALYSWETWGTGLKFFSIFVIAGLALSTFKALLKALARFIQRKKR